MTRTALILCTALSLSAAEPNEATRRWWSHVQKLASDDMQGREAGSEGYHRAAVYVAGEFERAGLKPAGVSGYYQPVPLNALRIASDQAEIALVRGSVIVPLRLNQQVAVTPRAGMPESFEAPLVFAGDGEGIEKLDLKKKIAVIFNTGGRPAAERTRGIVAAGATAVLSIDNPNALEPPRWPAAYATAMSIEGVERPAAPILTMRLNPASTEELFWGSGHTFQEILDLAGAHKPLPHFAFPAALRAQFHVTAEKLSADNILAVWPGSDPVLSKDYVVVSAHLDGYGIGEPVNGDNIYNGAFDDAACVANLIELAAALHRDHRRTRRSILFAVFTGEEKGLLGSNYFVSHPTIAKEHLVADINLDYLRPSFPLKILTTLGLKESTLGEQVRRTAGPLGIRIQADLEPERGLFRRSDQYNFIRNGIPGVAFIFGYEPGSPEEKIYRAWYADRYHRPSDDLTQPVDMEAAAKFHQFFSRLALSVADAAQRPRMNPNP